MATVFETDDRVDLSALARLQGNLFNAAPVSLTDGPTDAFRISSNERASVLGRRFGHAPLEPATPATTTDFDFGAGAIDMSSLRMPSPAPETAAGEVTHKATPPTHKSSNTYGG